MSLFSKFDNIIIDMILSFLESCDITHFCSHSKEYKEYIESISRLHVYPDYVTFKPLDTCHEFINQIKRTKTMVYGKISHITISRESTDLYGSITSVCISTSGLIVIGSKDSSVSVWCNKTFQLLMKRKYKGFITSLFALPNNQIACSTSTIYILDLNKKKCIKKLIGHTNSIISMILCEDTLISISEDGTSKKWNYTSNKVNIECSESIEQKYKMQCKLENGIAYATTDMIYLSKIPVNTRPCMISSISKLGHGFACGYFRGIIDIFRLTETNTYDIKFSINAHTDRVICLIEYSSEILISCSFDGIIKIWRIKDTVECIQTISIHLGIIRSIAIHSDMKSIVSVGDELKIYITPFNF